MHSTLHQYATEILEARIRHYIETPQSIIEHYKSEKENIYSYNGRQLLEMLQNADDAAARPNCEKKAFINLKDGYLTIANHGYPFSQGGLESILFSHLSPKAIEQNLIGQKGLGFRSILSWAEEVIISSDGLNLIFSEVQAAKVLEDIIAQKPTIKAYLATKTTAANPIAVLRVPAISEFSSDLQGSYDTIITIKLKPGIEEQVQDQIKTLVDEETLLFLNNLNEVRLESPKRNVQITKKTENFKPLITIKGLEDQSKTEKLWNVERKQGEYKNKNYELKIAWTDNLEMHSGKVHSYFKTNDVLSFPGLVHGTFELTPDRNHLVNDPNGYNLFLLAELAIFMVEVATRLTESHQPANYSAIRFLNINSNSVSGFFKEFKLIDLLKEEIKTRNLFPNVNGQYVDFKNNRTYYDKNIAQYLKGDDVASMLIHSENASIVSFIKNFGNYHYNAHHFSNIISKRINLPAEEYCALVTSMLESRQEEINKLNGDYSSLAPFFIDDEGKFIPWENEVFLPNEYSADPIHLPAEIKVSFLSKSLADAMLKVYGIQDYIHLDSRLQPFKFRRFTISGFAAILKEQYLNEPTVDSVCAFHYNLNRISAIQLQRNERVYSEQGLKYFVGLSRSGKIKPLSEMYFGIEYGRELTESLLKHEEDLLLAAPEIFGIAEDSHIKSYFQWLGVEAEPRNVTVKIDINHNDYHGFKSHMLSSYDYTPVFAGTRFTNRTQADAGINAMYVDSFEHLGSILSNASYTAIFQWIKENTQLRKILDSKYETKNQPMLGSPQTTGAVIYKKLPNYTKWLFASTKWIPSEEGHVNPESCCVSKTIGNLLSPLLVNPTLKDRKLKNSLETDSRGLEEYYRLIGIHMDLSSLSTQQLYTMLLELPKTDPAGKIAKSLYQEVMSNFDQDNIDIENEQYKKFISMGRIWAGKDGKYEYVDIDTAFYLETKRYGENITSEFFLVPLQRKQGNQKVSKLFGIKPLIGLNFTLAENPVSHSLNASFRQEMDQFKAFPYSLVLQFDSQERVKSALRSLNISLVSRLTGSFEHQRIQKNFILQDYDFVIIDSGTSSKYYIKVPLDVNSMLPLRSKLAFAESVAEIFSTIFRSENQRSLVRELYSRQPADREELLTHEIQIEGYQKLQQARERLGLDIDQRANFWRAIFIAKEISITASQLKEKTELEKLIKQNFRLKESTIQTLLSQENFRNTPGMPFISASYEVIAGNEIQLTKFNEHFEEIDFDNLLFKRYEMARTAMEKTFGYILYQQLSNEGDWKARSQYFGKCQAFSQSNYNSRDGFQNDIQAYLMHRTKIGYGIELDSMRIDDTWNVNKLFIEKHSESGLFKSANFSIEGLKESEVQSLILFGEFDILAEKLTELQERENQQDPEPERNESEINFEIDDYASVADKMDAKHDYSEYQIEEAGSVKGPNTPQGSSPRIGGRSYGGSGKSNHIDSEMIGFMAEKFVYESLKFQYPDGDPIWKSENGKRAGVYILGSAGHGYDIEYRDKDRIIYVEVKCIVNPELGFKMSNNELSFALANAADYLLITVENISTQKPNMTAYPEFFLFKEEDTLFDNSNFQIRQDNYNINFRKKTTG